MTSESESQYLNKNSRRVQEVLVPFQVGIIMTESEEKLEG